MDELGLDEDGQTGTDNIINLQSLCEIRWPSRANDLYTSRSAVTAIVTALEYLEENLVSIKTVHDFIIKHLIFCTQKQRDKLFPDTYAEPELHTGHLRNFGVTFVNNLHFRQHISQTWSCCFYHIHDLRRICRYMSCCHQSYCNCSC